MTESGPAELMRASEYDDEYYNYLGGREQLQDSPYNGARHVSAWVGDEMVGSVVYGQESGSAWVYHIYVRASHEGQGIGRQLCDEVADFARARGLAIDGDFTDAADTLKDYMNSRINVGHDLGL